MFIFLYSASPTNPLLMALYNCSWNALGALVASVSQALLRGLGPGEMIFTA